MPPSSPRDGQFRLAYIAASRFPSRAANSFQVMKMAEELCQISSETTLIAVNGEREGGPAPGDDDLKQIYGVRALPRMRLIDLSKGRAAIHLFNLRAALEAWCNGAHLVLSRSIGAAALAAVLGIPTIWECHAPPAGLERLYWKILVHASGFRRLVVISEALKRIVVERHPEAAVLDIVVAHDGVDLERFADIALPDAAKAAERRDPARPIAAYAGHLYTGRGIDIIIACARNLPEWTFLIAGGTPEDIAAVRSTLQKTGITNVELLGFINNSSLSAKLSAADVLLMPYQRSVMVSGGKLDTARWMSPLKMFEYLAMGRAIVASDLPVLREVLDEGTAMLVAADNAEAWIAALQRLASEPGLRSRLAARAAERAPEFSWKRRIQLMLNGLSQAA